jgi:protein-tyrosine-phosphatase
MTESSDRVRIAFVCVQNAGRSQMAFAFARREVAARDLAADGELLTGGTRPADHVHDEVVRAMDGVGIDIADRTPGDHIRGNAGERLRHHDGMFGRRRLPGRMGRRE